MIIDRQLNYGRNHIEAFLKAVTPFQYVLDVGAGEGKDLLLAKKVVSTSTLHAVECHLPYINSLQKNGIIVYNLNIERELFPFQDGSLDVVILNQVLEHIKEIFWVMHEVSRVLKVGGHLIVGVPNLASLHNRLLLLFGCQPTCLKNSSPHVRGFTKRDFLVFLETIYQGGYRLGMFKGSNFYPFPPLIASVLAEIFPNMAVGIFMLFEKHKPYTGCFMKWLHIQQMETPYYSGHF